MVITTQSQDDHCTLQLQGRFDANWADHVGNAMESVVRAGCHELDLDFAEVGYISSAGIRVLLKYYKQLKGVGGGLHVLRPTEAVLSVLRLSGLAAMLLSKAAPKATAPPAQRAEPAQPTITGDASPRRWQKSGVEFESFSLAAPEPLKGELLGSPESFVKGQLSAADSERLRCTTELMAVGLGAFGQRAEDTQGRFGETLATAGVAVTQPTDGSSVPDYQLPEGELVPELHLLYGLAVRGSFSRLFRFEANRSERGVISFGSLIDSAIEELKVPSAAFTILAESASVIGAMLKRSPASANGQSPLAFPGVRDWLNFTTERTDERNLVLIAGIAVRTPPPEAAAYLRRIGPGTEAHGHFHAAVFPYRPLPKGRLDLREAVAGVVGTESAQAVMHLLADEREFEGVGQTDLMRGACWAGPLQFTAAEPKETAQL